MPTPGLLRPPYPRDTCAGSACRRTLDADVRVFLFSNLDTGKLGVLCEECAQALELNDDTPWRLVTL